MKTCVKMDLVEGIGLANSRKLAQDVISKLCQNEVLETFEIAKLSNLETVFSKLICLRKNVFSKILKFSKTQSH